ARSLLGKQRIAADDQALAGIVGRGDLGEVVLIEQGELDHARRDETGDLWRPQSGDEVEAGWLHRLFDAGLSDHAAIADQHYPLELEALIDLADFACDRLRLDDLAYTQLHT